MASVSRQPIGVARSHVDDKTTVLVLVDMRSASGREFLAETLEDARATNRNLQAIRMVYRMSTTYRWMLWVYYRGKAVPLCLRDGALPALLGDQISWWKAKIRPESPVVSYIAVHTDPPLHRTAIEAIEEGITTSGMVLAKAAGSAL